MEIPALEKFFLVGGTALSLQYGHRTSIDLDLFCEETFDNEIIIAALESNFGKEIEYVNASSLFGIFCFIEKIKVDLVRYPHPLIASPILIDDIRMYNTDDIAAMKIKAILGRGKKKDFWDIAELFKHYSLNDIIKFHSSKYPSQQLLISIPYALTYFTDAEESDEPISLKGQTWEEVKNIIQKKVSEYLS